MKKPDCEEIVTSYNSDSDKFKAENKWHDRVYSTETGQAMAISTFADAWKSECIMRVGL